MFLLVSDDAQLLQFHRYCKAYFLRNPVAYQTLLPENETLSLESDRIRLPEDLPLIGDPDCVPTYSYAIDGANAASYSYAIDGANAASYSYASDIFPYVFHDRYTAVMLFALIAFSYALIVPCLVAPPYDKLRAIEREVRAVQGGGDRGSGRVLPQRCRT